MEERKKLTFKDLEGLSKKVAHRLLAEKAAAKALLNPDKSIEEAAIKRRQMIQECLAFLYEKFPKCFNRKNRHPLKVNIKDDICQSLGQKFPYSRKILHESLSYYTYNAVYLNKVISQDTRINLLGEPEGGIDKTHKDHAEKLLNKMTGKKRHFHRSYPSEKQ